VTSVATQRASAGMCRLSQSRSRGTVAEQDKTNALPPRTSSAGRRGICLRRAREHWIRSLGGSCAAYLSGRRVGRGACGRNPSRSGATQPMHMRRRPRARRVPQAQIGPGRHRPHRAVPRLRGARRLQEPALCRRWRLGLRRGHPVSSARRAPFGPRFRSRDLRRSADLPARTEAKGRRWPKGPRVCRVDLKSAAGGCQAKLDSVY